MIEHQPRPIDLIILPVSALEGEQLDEFANATGALVDSKESGAVLTYRNLSLHFGDIPYIKFKSSGTDGHRPADFPIHQGAVMFSPITGDFTFVQPPHIPGDNLVFTLSVTNGKIHRDAQTEDKLPEHIKKAFSLATEEREKAISSQEAAA